MKHQHKPRTPRGWADPWNPPLPAARRKEIARQSEYGWIRRRHYAPQTVAELKANAELIMSALDRAPPIIRQLVGAAGLNCAASHVMVRNWKRAEEALRLHLAELRMRRKRLQLAAQIDELLR